MLKSGLLFGSGLPKQVKELTEVDRVGKKVSRHSGIRSMTKSDIITRLDFQSFWESGCLSSSQNGLKLSLGYHRHNFYAHGRGHPGHQYYRKHF